MVLRFVKYLLAIGVVLVLAVPASAQEAVLTGTVTDSTGAVLPGVTVTAVHEATGNRFVAVTDERGVYRIPARVGGYVAGGQRAQTIYGGDVRNIAGVGGPETLARQRLRPDGTIVPRNSFTQPTRQRVDLRLQQRFTIGRFAIDGIAEVFNLANSPNWTIETTESNRQFGQAVLAEFRRAQLGFRVTF